MSAQPSLQQFRNAPGEEETQGKESPAAGEKVQARKETIIKSTRVEFGFFLRKKVDGRVVHEWQFPPFKRQAELKVEPPPVPPQPAAPTADQQAGDEPVMQVQALTLDPAASGDAPSSEESSTTYEGGFFFRTESVTPPDWGSGSAEEPPKSG